MVTPPQTTASTQLNRRVLLQSWAMLSVYDQTASDLKRQFVERRRNVILLTAIATIASIGVGLLGVPFLATLLGFMAIILPLIATFLMNDIVKFTGTTSWIKYRYTAEMMRMHLYLYRMKAGIYASQPAEFADDLLSKTLIEVRDGVKWDEVIPPTTKEPIEEKDIQAVIQNANSSTPEDDGLSEIKIEDYIRWRVDQQRHWYDSKIEDDFAEFKRLYRAAQIALLVGTLLSALDMGLVSLVAMTSAISLALTSWSNVNMSGKTYSLFQIASMQLGDQKRNWNSLQNNPELADEAANKAAQTALVQGVENVLLWEREEWYELALQAQVVGDKMILGDLTRLTQRAHDAQKEK